MERDLPRGRLQSITQEYCVRELDRPDDIRSLLEPDRSYAAYALGQLEHSYFHLSQWWQAETAGMRALVLHSRGGLGDAVFTLGDAPAVDAVLALHPGPVRTFVTCRVEHLDVVKRHYFMSQQQVMMRMAVDSPSFGPVADGYSARRLRGRDVRALNHLYGSEGGATFYTSWHLEDGIYFGVFESNRLIAAAGTHVVAPRAGIAVVGNVFTHPARRGRGYATAATSAVTSELMRTCPEVVLTVDPNNTAAVAAYRRLGYRERGRLIEAAAVRKDVSGWGSRLRRFFARHRSRDGHSELIPRRFPTG